MAIDYEKYAARFQQSQPPQGQQPASQPPKQLSPIDKTMLQKIKGDKPADDFYLQRGAQAYNRKLQVSQKYGLAPPEAPTAEGLEKLGKENTKTKPFAAFGDIVGGVFKRAVPDTIASVATVVDDPYKSDGMLDKFIDNNKQAQQEYINGPGADDIAIPFTQITRKEIREGITSLGFSAASWIAARLGGAATGAAIGTLAEPLGGTLIGGAIGFVGTAAAAGAMAYKLDKNSFIREYRSFLDAQRGQPLTDEEFAQYRSGKVADLLAEHGLHEAGWEGIATAIEQGTLARIGGGLPTRAIKGLLSLALFELGSEAGTQIGQTNVETKLGMHPDEELRSYMSPKDWLVSAREVLPAVLVMAGTIGGVETGVHYVGDKVHEGRVNALRQEGLDVPALNELAQNPAELKARGIEEADVVKVMQEQVRNQVLQDLNERNYTVKEYEEIKKDKDFLKMTGITEDDIAGIQQGLQNEIEAVKKADNVDPRQEDLKKASNKIANLESLPDKEKAKPEVKAQIKEAIKERDDLIAAGVPEPEGIGRTTYAAGVLNERQQAMTALANSQRSKESPETAMAALRESQDDMEAYVSAIATKRHKPDPDTASVIDDLVENHNLIEDVNKAFVLEDALSVSKQIGRDTKDIEALLETTKKEEPTNAESLRENAGQISEGGAVEGESPAKSSEDIQQQPEAGTAAGNEKGQITSQQNAAALLPDGLKSMKGMSQAAVNVRKQVAEALGVKGNGYASVVKALKDRAGVKDEAALDKWLLTNRQKSGMDNQRVDIFQSLSDMGYEKGALRLRGLIAEKKGGNISEAISGVTNEDVYKEYQEYLSGKKDYPQEVKEMFDALKQDKKKLALFKREPGYAADKVVGEQVRPASVEEREQMVRDMLFSKEREAGHSIPDAAFKVVAPRNKVEKRVAELGSFLGLDVLFYTSTALKPNTINGVTHPNMPRTVFIRRESSNPIVQVVGHEFVHVLSRTHTDQFKALITTLKDSGRFEGIKFKRWRDNLDRISGEKNNDIEAQTEFLGDFVGDLLLQKNFARMMKTVSDEMAESKTSIIAEGRVSDFKDTIKGMLTTLGTVVEKILQFFSGRVGIARDASLSEMRRIAEQVNQVVYYDSVVGKARTDTIVPAAKRTGAEDLEYQVSDNLKAERDRLSKLSVQQWKGMLAGLRKNPPIPSSTIAAPDLKRGVLGIINKLLPPVAHAKKFPAMRKAVDSAQRGQAIQHRMTIEDKELTRDYYQELDKTKKQQVNDLLMWENDNGKEHDYDKLTEQGLDPAVIKGWWGMRQAMNRRLKQLTQGALPHKIAELADKRTEAADIIYSSKDRKELKSRMTEWLKANNIELNPSEFEHVSFLFDHMQAHKGYVPHKWKHPWRVMFTTIGKDGKQVTTIKSFPMAASILPREEQRTAAAVDIGKGILKDDYGWSDAQIAKAMENADKVKGLIDQKRAIIEKRNKTSNGEIRDELQSEAELIQAKIDDIMDNTPTARIIHSRELPTDFFEGARPEQMQSIMSTAIGNALDKMSQNDKDVAGMFDEIDNQVKSEMELLYLKKGGLKSLIARKNVQGYREDLDNVIAEYLGETASTITKRDMAREMADVLSGINAKQQPALWQEVKDYAKDVLSPTPEARAFKMAAGVMYLGGDISAVILNSTQNFTHGVGTLWSIKQANGGGNPVNQIMKASKDVALAWMEMKKKERAGETDPQLFPPGGIEGVITPDEVTILNRMKEEGQLDPQLLGEQTGFQLNQISEKRYVMAAMFKLFGAAEGLNRLSLALAASRRALSTGKDIEETMKIASRAVEKAHFLYGRSNRPKLVRDLDRATGKLAIGSTGYTFMTYPVMNLLYIRNYMWNMFEGVYKGDKAQTRAAMKQAGAQLGFTFLFGGMTALPFYGLAQAVASIFGDDDDEDWETTMRKQIDGVLGPDVATGVTRGVPAMMRLFDMSQSVEGTDVFQTPVGIQVLEQMYKRFGESWDMVLHDEYTPAMFHIMPDFIRNPYRALLGMQMGGEFKYAPPIKYTPKEAATRALGLTPPRESLAYQKAGQTLKMQEKRAARIADMARRVQNDRSEIRNVRKEMNAYNQEAMKKRLPRIVWNDILKAMKRQKEARQKNMTDRPAKYMKRYQESL